MLCHAITKLVLGGFGINVHIDAKEYPDSLGRYINDCRNESETNAKFVKLRAEKKALVVATRFIKVCSFFEYSDSIPFQSGSEIYASYGESYWRKHGA